MTLTRYIEEKKKLCRAVYSIRPLLSLSRDDCVRYVEYEADPLPHVFLRTSCLPGTWQWHDESINEALARPDPTQLDSYR